MQEAVTYYSDIDSALSKRLTDAFGEVLQRIREHPLIGAEYQSNYRRMVVTPFPYLLAYYVDDDNIFVAGLLHVLRDPETNKAILERR